MGAPDIAPRDLNPEKLTVTVTLDANDAFIVGQTLRFMAAARVRKLLDDTTMTDEARELARGDFAQLDRVGAQLKSAAHAVVANNQSQKDPT